MAQAFAQPEATGTVDKAIDVLFHLHAAAGPEGVTSVGRALGLPKSSAHRLLASLSRRGLVERTGRGRYQLGVGLIALGLGALDREPVAAAARPVLESCAARLDETIFLVVARGTDLVVLEKAEGTGWLRAAPPVGSTVPIHATAVGKLFLAYAPERFSPPQTTAEVERFTPDTLTDIATLAGAVAEARSRRFATNRDEWIAGMSVVAAPVVVGGAMTAAIALAASSPRVDALGVEQVAATLIEAGQEIADRLGGPVSSDAAGRSTVRRPGRTS